MKKLLSILLMVLVVGFCFADEALEVEENSQTVDMSVLEAQNQLLQLLNENQLDQDALSAIAAANEAITEEHETKKEEIEYNKPQNVLKRNLKNREGKYICFGVNLPLQLENLDMDSISKSFTKLNNWGIGIHNINFGTKWFSIKSDFSFNFIKINNQNEFSLSIMGYLGLSPFHNRYFYTGLYAGIGLDMVAGYSCFDVAGCGVFTYNMTENLGIFINIDAAYRMSQKWHDKNEPDPEYNVSHIWKVTPSIGLSYKL